jgi:hypothetical protein
MRRVDEVAYAATAIRLPMSNMLNAPTPLSNVDLRREGATATAGERSGCGEIRCGAMMWSDDVECGAMSDEMCMAN